MFKQERSRKFEVICMFYPIFTELCNQAGLKPNSFGKLAGVSSSTLTAWKNGMLPNAESLIKIADFFKVPIDYLLGRTKIKKPIAESDELVIAIKNRPALMELSKYLSNLDDDHFAAIELLVHSIIEKPQK